MSKMNLFTDQLDNWDEPQTPRWWYHCRDHLEEPLFKYNDPHFQTGHGGKDPSCLRVRCSGGLCVHCLKMPLSQDAVDTNQQDATPESAPKLSASSPSETENDSYSDEDPLPSDDEDLSKDDSSLADEDIAPPTLPEETPAGAKSMGDAEPEFSNLQPDQEHSGDDMNQQVAVQMSSLVGHVSSAIAGVRDAHM